MVSRGPEEAVGLRSDLWSVGAFKRFMNRESSDRSGDGDGVPDELALGGLDWRAAVTLAASATRALRVRSIWIENDAIAHAFGNFADVVFHSDSERAAIALNDQFLGSENRNLPDGGLVGSWADDSRTDMQSKRFRIGGRKCRGAMRK